MGATRLRMGNEPRHISTSGIANDVRPSPLAQPPSPPVIRVCLSLGMLQAFRGSCTRCCTRGGTRTAFRGGAVGAQRGRMPLPRRYRRNHVSTTRKGVSRGTLSPPLARALVGHEQAAADRAIPTSLKSSKTRKGLVKRSPRWFQNVGSGTFTEFAPTSRSRADASPGVSPPASRYLRGVARRAEGHVDVDVGVGVAVCE